MAKTAVVNLVDLAGSERVDSTGATGDRLKEERNFYKKYKKMPSGSPRRNWHTLKQHLLCIQIIYLVKMIPNLLERSGL